jgi:hypothetical protein
MCAAFRISVRNNSITVQISRIDALHSSDMSLFLQLYGLLEKTLPSWIIVIGVWGSTDLSRIQPNGMTALEILPDG